MANIPAKYIKQGVTIDGVTGTLNKAELCTFFITGSSSGQNTHLKSSIIKSITYNTAGQSYAKRHTNTTIAFNNSAYVYGYIFTNYIKSNIGGAPQSVSVKNPNFGFATPSVTDGKIQILNATPEYTLFSAEVTAQTTISIPNCGPAVTLGNTFMNYPSYCFLFQVE